MKPIFLILIAALLTASSCSSMGGLKRVDGQPQPEVSKPGITWGSPVGKVEVQKGYWCEVKGGILTFGQSGPTEAKATELARQKCHSVLSSSPCELVSCKPN